MYRDIKLYTGRTILTILGILIGIASVGAVLTAYSILGREMNRNYMDTNPASIVLNIKNMDEKALNLLKNNYPETDIELRKTQLARINNGDGTYSTI